MIIFKILLSIVQVWACHSQIRAWAKNRARYDAYIQRKGGIWIPLRTNRGR